MDELKSQKFALHNDTRLSLLMERVIGMTEHEQPVIDQR
jgi:hypothetical protein